MLFPLGKCDLRNISEVNSEACFQLLTYVFRKKSAGSAPGTRPISLSKDVIGAARLLPLIK